MLIYHRKNRWKTFKLWVTIYKNSRYFYFYCVHPHRLFSMLSLQNEKLSWSRLNIEKITVFERRNNVSLSTLNQRRSFTLKQRWFLVDSKKQFCSHIHAWKTKIFKLKLRRWPYFNVETRAMMILSWLYESFVFTLWCSRVIIFILTLKRFTFQHQNIINLSTLKQRQNLMLKQRWFMVELKTNYVLCYTNRLNTWNNVEILSRGQYRRIFTCFVDVFSIDN